MDLGVFERRVITENDPSGGVKASIRGVKSIEDDGYYSTSTIFGVGADGRAAQADLALKIIEAAKAGTAVFMRSFGETETLVPNGQNVAFAL